LHRLRLIWSPRFREVGARADSINAEIHAARNPYTKHINPALDEIE
jgi:hypothetical protein